MANFNFLKSDPQFATFANTAIEAELVLPISPAFAATGSRAALEFAVKWLYSMDNSLVKPYDERLSTLMHTDDFKNFLPHGLFPKINYIRKLGNNAAHSPSGVTADQAALSLENLHSFMSFVDYRYGVNPKKEPFVVKPMDFTEDMTRKAYIDVMLEDAGWRRGENWIDEYPINEMPNKSGKGAADYVLLGDDGVPLAVIEAKRTAANVEKGRQQAVLYANFLQKKFGTRPVIFLTNGYETRIWNDDVYPERVVSGIYSKYDLQKEFNKMRNRKPLKGVTVNDNISNRYYQKEAIQAVCETFDERNRRKALLVMATGSGKTRTVISIVDILERYGWVKNVLFLADRTALVTQAKRAFHNLMPNLSLCNLTEDKENANARAVFSIYQTMMNCIDDTRDEQGDRLFTPGHFDLIIVDEAHRSIYRKYKDIFNYFDALLIGLTATPKDEIGKDTYEIFELETGVPTYGYELSQAVKDGYLVDFVTIETELKFMSEGISYDDLTPDEKEIFEETFTDEDGNVPPSIDATALNEWLFNHDTIKKALHVLMENGQRIDYGTKIGKTIIFAKNHNHAEKISKVWDLEFPNYPPHYCRVIDNYEEYAQSLIDDFSDPQKCAANPDRH
jgi:type I restriction enzyme R subunit